MAEVYCPSGSEVGYFIFFFLFLFDSSIEVGEGMVGCGFVGWEMFELSHELIFCTWFLNFCLQQWMRCAPIENYGTIYFILNQNTLAVVGLRLRLSFS